MTVKTEQLLNALSEHFLSPERAELMRLLKDGTDEEKARAAISMVPEAIFMIEQIDKDMQLLATGAEKKHAIVKLLDDAIRLPFWAELFDGPLLAELVDQMVKWYNTSIGHDWIDKLKSIALGA